MEVILKKDIEMLGKAGTVVKVKDGYARNFLIPNGMALFVTPASLKNLEQDRQRELSQLEKVKKEARELSAKLAALSLTITVLTQEKDELYASVTARDISGALAEEGISIDKNLIILEEPIKSLGIYEIPVKLHAEISATVKVWVVKK